MKIDVYRVGGWLGGTKFTIDERYLKYDHIYGGNFKILRKDIQAIVLSPSKIGRVDIKFIGQGTELASSVRIPQPWAEKAHEWLSDRLLSAQ